jgi:hypothetical protein
MIGGTRSRRLSSTIETPDGLPPSAQCLVAISLDTGGRQRTVFRGRGCRARNLLAGVFVTPRADGESPAVGDRSASEALDVEHRRLLLPNA